jgi:hypothetical protein
MPENALEILLTVCHILPEAAKNPARERRTRALLKAVVAKV